MLLNRAKEKANNIYHKTVLLRVKKIIQKTRKKQKKILFFTVHKAASVFIYKICQKLCDLSWIIHYSPHGGDVTFSEKEPLKNTDFFTNKIGCFAPLRFFIDVPNIEDYIVFLHLRDPRDVLVSLFFSSVYSHPRKPGIFNPTNAERQKWEKEGIDKYVLDRAKYFLSRYENYCDSLLGKPNVTFIRYEDMVADLYSWLSKVVSPFDIANKENVIKFFIKKYGHIYSNKQKENIYAHIRNVTPGDYKNKLRPETIHRLNAIFKDVLIKLHYM